jgi:hypothetical protein
VSRALDFPSKALTILEARLAFLESLWRLRRPVILELRNEGWTLSDIEAWAERWHLSMPWLELWASNANTWYRTGLQRIRDDPNYESDIYEGDFCRCANDPDRFFELAINPNQSCHPQPLPFEQLRYLHELDITRSLQDRRNWEKDWDRLDRACDELFYRSVRGKFTFSVELPDAYPLFEDHAEFISQVNRELDKARQAAERRRNARVRGLARRGWTSAHLKPKLQTHAEWTVRSYVPPIETSAAIARTLPPPFPAAGVRKAIAEMARILELPPHVRRPSRGKTRNPGLSERSR